MLNNANEDKSERAAFCYFFSFHLVEEPGLITARVHLAYIKFDIYSAGLGRQACLNFFEELALSTDT